MKKMKIFRWVIFLPVSILIAFVMSNLLGRIILPSIGVNYSILLDFITPFIFC